MDKSRITVALPLWESADIAWLCMESLCRQDDPLVPWTIIVAEEQTENAMGYRRIMDYLPRIRAIGGYIDYHPLDKKIPLVQKWKYIAEAASESSLVYHMCAGDNYYQPNMLRSAFGQIACGDADWFQSYRCHFYDIDTGALVKYQKKKYCGIEMAMSTELARKIPLSTRPKGIDAFVMSAVQPQNIVWDESENWIQTVCTHGRNKISGTNRKNLINKTRAPFKRTEFSLQDCLPEDIYQRLTS